MWCEDEGTTTNLEGRVIKINSAADPPGESKRDWEIVCDLAKRLGRGKFFPYQSALDIWNDLREASKGGISDYYGITWEKIDEQGGVFWPCPSADHPGTPRLFTERFGHPDGKAKMFPISYKPPAEEPGPDFPFRLTTGRVVYQYLSGNQTRRLGFLNSQAPEPWVEIHPQAAARLGIVNDEVVRVRTLRGAMHVKALVVSTIRPDVLFIPYHYGHEHAVNQLTNPAVEPNVKIPEYKVCAATVEKLSTSSFVEGNQTQGAKENFTPETMPKMFPYTIGETKDQSAKKAKTY